MRHVRLCLAGLALASCAPKSSPDLALPRVGEAQGLYFFGFEASHFRPCADSTGFGDRVSFESAADDVMRENRQAGVAWRSSGGWTYQVYYVRWVMRRLPEPESPSGSVVIIKGGPRHVVAEVLEVRAPRPHECGLVPD